MNISVRTIKYFFRVQVLQLALSLIWMFLTQSSKPIFLGLSLVRLPIAGITALLFILTSTILIRAERSSTVTQKFQSFLDKKLVNDKFLVPVLIALLAFAGLVISLTAFILSTPLDKAIYGTWAPETFTTLYLSIQYLLPLLVFSIAITLEAFGCMVVCFQYYLRSKEFWAWKTIEPTLLGILLVFVTLGHWLILFFQIRIFVNIPGWYWSITNKSFSIRDIIYILIVVSLLSGAAWFVFTKKKSRWALFLIFLACLWLQAGINFLDKGNFQSVGDRYFISSHSVYPKLASSNRISVLDNIQNYGELFRAPVFTQTKPPGLMAFYISLERVVNGNASTQTMTDDLRFARIRKFIVFLFPVLAALVILLLYAFTRKCLHFEKVESVLITSIFVLCPNFVLFSLFTDQAIYPFLFLTGAWLTIWTIQRQSPGLMVLMGILLYGFSFFAFTMLPLFPIAGIYLFLHWFQDSKRIKIKRQILLGALFLLGVVIAYWFFRWIFNYDFITRFSTSMTINHNMDFYLRLKQQLPTVPETFLIRVKQIIGSIRLNNLEFATITGVPFFILFFVYGVRLTIRIIKRKTASSDSILASFFLSFLAVNLGGTAQGEVGRLWLFWVPMVVIFAVMELRHWNLIKLPVFLLFVGTQLVTLMLTYHFQDLILFN